MMTTPLTTYSYRLFMVLICLLLLTPEAYSQRRQRRRPTTSSNTEVRSAVLPAVTSSVIIAGDQDYDDEGSLRPEFLQKLIAQKMPYVRRELAAASTTEDRDDWLSTAEDVYYEYEHYAEKNPSVATAFLHVDNAEWEISDLVDEWYETEEDSAEERLIESKIETAVRAIMSHKLMIKKFDLEELRKEVEEAESNPSVALKKEVDSWLE